VLCLHALYADTASFQFVVLIGMHASIISKTSLNGFHISVSNPYFKNNVEEFYPYKTLSTLP
jgi:hypothetical protein